MKILFLSNIGLPPTFPHEDYLNDMVFHGFRSLFGADCVDVAKNKSMYKGYRDNPDKPMYGKGFTLYGTLDDIKVDREDIESKIKNKFFDYVVYGQVTRSRPYLQLVNDNYNRRRIIMCDGEDDSNYSYQYRDMSMFFKRELQDNDMKVFPVSFSIPKDKILKEVPNKIQEFAGTPTNQHVFSTEQDYYEEYQRSYFGITHKKAGWDCLRHYEILMNRCIPYFRDLRQLPHRTMHFYPRKLNLQAMNLANIDPIPLDQYLELENELNQYLLDHFTTEQVVKYILDAASWK